MVWGVMTQGWWFPIMASMFLAFTIVIMLMVALGKDGLGEKVVVDAFVEGASSLVGVSLIIGLARGINMIMNDGLISDTILNFSSSLVQGVSGPIFIVILLIIFFFLGFIIPSSSGLAVLAMPIFAPLADTVGIPRFVIVTDISIWSICNVILSTNRIDNGNITNVRHEVLSLVEIRMASRCLRIHLRWWHAYHSSINLFIIEELNIRTVNGVYDVMAVF